jgi:hypothetical protein
MKKGGNSATEYGGFVWGMTPRSVPGSGNLIQASGDPTKFKGGKRKGGKRSQKNRCGGEGILTAAGVPALLITANHLYKRKTNKGNKPGGKKIIIGGNASVDPITSEILQQQLGQLKQTSDMTKQMMNPNQQPAKIISNSAETKTGGKGVIETVSIPALFVTANHIYRPRKTRKHKKNVRFSMKKR